MIEDMNKTEAGKDTFDLNFHEESGNYIVVETYVPPPFCVCLATQLLAS